MRQKVTPKVGSVKKDFADVGFGTQNVLGSIQLGQAEIIAQTASTCVIEGFSTCSFVYLGSMTDSRWLFASLNGSGH